MRKSGGEEAWEEERRRKRVGRRTRTRPELEKEWRRGLELEEEGVE
jgi:hypothetical protein